MVQDGSSFIGLLPHLNVTLRKHLCRVSVALLLHLLANLMLVRTSLALSVGDTAPALHGTVWLTYPSNDPSPPSKTPIVLEFWATWCAPCRLSIPHLNRIASALADEHVAFVAITSEAPNTVSLFTNNSPIAGFVGCDTARTLHSAFGVTAVPRSFLINREGIVCWYGHPMSLTEEVVRRFVESESCPAVYSETSRSGQKPVPVTANSVYSLTFNHSAFDINDDVSGSSMSQRSAGGQYEAQFRGQSLSSILGALLDVSIPRLRLVTTTHDDPVLDVSLYVSPPMNPNTARLEAANTISRAFGLIMLRKTEPIHVWSLTCPERNNLVKTQAENSGTYNQNYIWSASGIGFDELVASLESTFGEVFFNEAGITGAYDFELPSNDLERAIAVLRDRYGVVAERCVRDIEVYEFMQATDAK